MKLWQTSGMYYDWAIVMKFCYIQQIDAINLKENVRKKSMKIFGIMWKARKFVKVKSFKTHTLP